MGFGEQFLERTSRFEKLLIICAVLSLWLLLVVQVLISGRPSSVVLSIVDRLEGVPFIPR
ncbi:MAG: hypothetical protein M1571_00095 [Firmicutes bacterium]|nr:hypothetical protein [Bacillota bacterium]